MEASDQATQDDTAHTETAQQAQVTEQKSTQQKDTTQNVAHQEQATEQGTTQQEQVAKQESTQKEAITPSKTAQQGPTTEQNNTQQKDTAQNTTQQQGQVAEQNSTQQVGIASTETQKGQVTKQESTQKEEHTETGEENRLKNELDEFLGSEEDANRSGFVHGISVGLGFGCIAIFIIVWTVVFFTPRLPEGISYESMLSIFIYPLLYVLAVGSVALTVGILKEYYSVRRKPRA